MGHPCEYELLTFILVPTAQTSPLNQCHMSLVLIRLPRARVQFKTIHIVGCLCPYLISGIVGARFHWLYYDIGM